VRIFDSHQHFWRLHAPSHTWPDAAWPAIHRDFLPDDLRAAAAGVDLVGTVLVQAQPDDRDTDWMLQLAAQDPLIEGVVGWVDLADPGAPARIATLAAHPKLKGLRPMLQGMADTEWILSPAVSPAIETMIAAGLRLDALVEPGHLPVLLRLAARWPALAIVIDHAAKPPAATGRLDPWRDAVAACAQLGMYCKLSGLRTEQAPGQPAEDLAPYVTHLVDTFGERLMWGSDWPVLMHARDSYWDWIETCRHLARLDTPREAWLFEGAARRFYGCEG
jgi:L-fuconolactonase